MADDERRAEIEAAVEAAMPEMENRFMWAASTGNHPDATAEGAVRTILEPLLDRVRDARGDEGLLPDCEHGYFAAGGTDTCPACDADALDYLERRKAEAEARDARGDDEAARLDDERVALALEVGELRAKLKRAEAARSPQVEFRGYLPMDCPTCGRRRLMYGVNDEGGVIYVECEKCGSNSDDETLWTPRQQGPFARSPQGEDHEA